MKSSLVMVRSLARIARSQFPAQTGARPAAISRCRISAVSLLTSFSHSHSLRILLRIADALEKNTGIKLDKRKIVIADPIKNVGTYTVNCKLGYEITAPLTVKIEEL